MTRDAGRPRAVFVGAGEVTASYWLPGVALLGWHAVVLDLDGERADEVAARAGRRVRAVRSLAEAAPTPRDVVVIATPPRFHGSAAREAVAAGARRLIIEKPPFDSPADMDETLADLRRHGAAARSAFIRRDWRPIAEARRLFPSWRERFGPLERVRISEGRPYGWASRAAVERGAAGLSSMLHDELPHALDALFGIARWGDVEVLGATVERLEVLDMDAAATLGTGDGRVELEMRGSRTAQLAQALDLGFATGSVSVDMQPNGGIVVRNSSGPPALIACGGMPAAVEPMFAALLSAAASDPIEPWIGALESWRGPLRIAERVQGQA